MAQFDTDDLKKMQEKRAEEATREPYRPRPKWQLVFAWILAGIVLFAFFGMCYWMMRYGV